MCINPLRVDRLLSLRTEISDRGVVYDAIIEEYRQRDHPRHYKRQGCPIFGCLLVTSGDRNTETRIVPRVFDIQFTLTERFCLAGIL